MQLLNINLYTFVATILLLIGAVFWDGLLEYDSHIFLASILLVGIPHGAIDHIIHFRERQVSNTNLIRFYSQYIGLVVIVGLVWYLFPDFSFISFLIVSAYHFGQSQLYYIKFNKLVTTLFFTAWGVLLLSSIILFNYNECYSIFKSFDWLSTKDWLSKQLLISCLVLSALAVGVGLLSAFLFKKVSGKFILFEIVLLVVLIALSISTNAIFTFTIYFGLWHSLRSLILEYKEVKVILHSPSKFIKALLPFTFISFVGLIGVYYFLNVNFIGISPYMIFIVMISALTVPHLVVMDRLYKSVV